MADRICIHCYITGRVQGVWFRASTKEQADQLGITGWVRNLPDGRVEVLACGEKENVALLQAWLKHGPRLAKVIDFVYEERPWQDHRAFETV